MSQITKQLLRKLLNKHFLSHIYLTFLFMGVASVVGVLIDVIVRTFFIGY